MSRRTAANSSRRTRGRTRHPARAQSVQGLPDASRNAGAAVTHATVEPKPTGEVEPEALVATGWFHSGEGDEPYSATIRFTGQRLGVAGRPQSRDTFVQDEIIDGILPGTGRVAVTAWVYGLNPGAWTVSAQLIRPSGARRVDRRPNVDPAGTTVVHPARWSWRRWAVETAPAQLLGTRWALIAPLARTPAVIPGIYTVLAIVGAIIALAVQAAILGGEGVAVGSTLAVSLLALVSGLIGAKVWYAVLHPEESIIRAGWAVDGFLVVAPVVAAIGLMVANLPIGRVVDATTPGLFFAVAIGRVGCFFTGCCAGRWTDSRWGVWSSDRRVGARRVPTQLMESVAGLVLGIGTLPLAAGHVLPIHGAVFVAAFGGYAVARQALLRLRAEQRGWSRRLPITAGAAVAVLALVSVLAAIQIAGTPSLA